MLRKLLAVLTVSILSLGLSSLARAEFVIFTLEQVGGEISIPLGSTAQFRVLIRSETAPLTNLDGVDFNVGADDDGVVFDSGMRTAGGQFTAASTLGFGGFSIAPTSSYLAFSGTNYPVTLPTTDVEIANFVLDTTGGTAGTYNMTLTNALAIDEAFQAIGIKYWNNTGVLPYTITPVPEPSLLALASLGLVGLKLRRRRPLECGAVGTALM